MLEASYIFESKEHVLQLQSASQATSFDYTFHLH